MSVDNPARNGVPDQAEVAAVGIPDAVAPRAEVDLPLQSRAEAFERANTAGEQKQEAEPLPVLVDIPPGQTRLEHFESLANAFPVGSDHFPGGPAAETSERAATMADFDDRPAVTELGRTAQEQISDGSQHGWRGTSESTNDNDPEVVNHANAMAADGPHQTDSERRTDAEVVSETPRADAMRASRPDRIPPPAWDRMCDGVAFNEQREPHYTERGGGNEINLENGKRLDSYIPGDEIVSRKHTQLGDVSEATAIDYVRELGRKYDVGEVIKDTPHNRDELPTHTGRPLRGQHILEIPPQANDIPREVLREAESRDVIIRDTNGKVYELPDDEE